MDLIREFTVSSDGNIVAVENFVDKKTITTPFITPSSGKLFRFLRDEETSTLGFDFKSRVVSKNYKRGALPATVQLDGTTDFIPLTKEYQELWFECLKWQASGMMTHDELLEAWKSVTMHSRALTDLHSREQGYRDWILGVNMTGKDMEQRLLSTAGNIGEALWGGTRVTFKAIDLSKPAPKIENIWGNPTLVWWATETDRPNWYEGGKIDINGRWPQIHDSLGHKLGVPFLNVSPYGLNYVPSTRIEYIKNNVLYTPYNPPSS